MIAALDNFERRSSFALTYAKDPVVYNKGMFLRLGVIVRRIATKLNIHPNI